MCFSPIQSSGSRRLSACTCVQWHVLRRWLDSGSALCKEVANVLKIAGTACQADLERLPASAPGHAVQCIRMPWEGTYRQMGSSFCVRSHPASSLPAWLQLASAYVRSLRFRFTCRQQPVSCVPTSIDRLAPLQQCLKSRADVRGTIPESPSPFDHQSRPDKGCCLEIGSILLARCCAPHSQGSAS